MINFRKSSKTKKFIKSFLSETIYMKTISFKLFINTQWPVNYKADD